MKFAVVLIVVSLSVLCLDTVCAESSKRDFYEIKYVIQLEPNFEISGRVICDKYKQCDVYQNQEQDFSLALTPKTKNQGSPKLFIYCKNQPCFFEWGKSYSELKMGGINVLDVYKGQYPNGLEVRKLRKFGELVMSIN